MKKVLGFVYVVTCLTSTILVLIAVVQGIAVLLIGIPLGDVAFGFTLVVLVTALIGIACIALADPLEDLGNEVLWDLNASKRRTQEAYDQLANTKSKGDNS